MTLKINPLLINKTRFADIGFTQTASGLWRFVDMNTGYPVGPRYDRKDELLADLTTMTELEANIRALTETNAQLLAVLEQSVYDTEQLCRMVNTYSSQLGLGDRKVRAVDWTEKAQAAIAKAKEQS